MFRRERAHFEAVRPVQQSQGSLQARRCSFIIIPTRSGIRGQTVQEQLVPVLVLIDDDDDDVYESAERNESYHNSVDM